MATKKNKTEIVRLPAKKHYTLPNYTFGVEIECFNLSPDILAWKMNENKLKVGGYEISESVCSMLHLRNRDNYSAWDIGDDGSIRGRDSVEIRSPILRGESGLKEIEKVCAILNDIGAKVNNSCGLHVHVGIKNSKRKFSVDQIIKLMEVYEDNSKNTDRWLRRARRTGHSTYARSVKDLLQTVKKKTRTSMQTQYDPMTGQYRYATSEVPVSPPKNLNELARMGEHFHRVNFSAYQEHGTVEFRQHHGTLNAREITNWIRFLLNHVENSRAAAKLEKRLKTQAERTKKRDKIQTIPKVVVQPLLGLPEPVRKHFESRVKKYRNAA